MPRIALFTDTLTDINGVARFVFCLAAHDPDIHILTTSRHATSSAPNIHIIPPLFARPMPGYPLLDLAIPNPRAIATRAAALNPDAIHISTPGPVGLAGRRFALRHNLPLLGTYHTDFPAYIDSLFDDAALTRLSASLIRRFYAPFDRILIRTPGFAAPLSALGLAPHRIFALPPGIDTDLFHPRHRDPSIWSHFPAIRAASIKVLYVGRISIEKNLPLLARLWPRLRASAAARNIDAQLLIVGDGPYRPPMQRDLAAHDTHVLGFRHAAELSAIYASSDLFLFPSLTDTLGQAVMEAQSSGLPAIVTNRGGPRDIIHHAHTGLALDPSDDWCAATLTLLENAPLRARMSTAARARLAPMTITRSITAFRAIHQSVINERAHSR